jgi:hypothetical protein
MEWDDRGYGPVRGCFCCRCCLTDLFDGASFPCFIWGIDARRVALDGLNKPFQLENLLFSWPFSWILNLTSLRSSRDCASCSCPSLGPYGDVLSSRSSFQCSALSMCFPFSGSTPDAKAVPPSQGHDKHHCLPYGWQSWQHMRHCVSHK